ncbi:hypothetical protein GCM10011506_08940 [Marivirga lumbricoides]|uniref:Thioredoxin domain-containing protein n=1 Tax=Marivirga lumbricoides TaxID=1046115 RepID=A0ABQ1LNY6_9BACT|nr:hypothetical protein GCM10011506_08940 [Marivirga lumbricoides]
MKRMLKQGDIAPAISTLDLWDKKINVPTQEKWVYLTFHRFAACPFCNLRTNELIRHYDSFEKNNLEIISIWPSDKENLLRYVGSKKSPFPLLSDKDKTIYKSYCVTESSFVGAIKLLLHPRLIMNAVKQKPKDIEIDGDLNLMPASFLVDASGIIQMAYYGKHYGDHPSIEYIFKNIK